MDNSVMDNTATDMNQGTVEAAVQDERMLPQSKVNELIGQRVKEASEKAAARAVEEYRKQAEAQQSQTYNNTQRYFSEEDIERKANEVLTKRISEFERQTQENNQMAEANRIVDAYKQKIAAGASKYQDFGEVTGAVDMRDFPNFVALLADHADNAADILYDLSKRPSKMDEIERLCERSPKYAISEMKRLSESIKANEAANQQKQSRAPLTQQRPSNTGTDSGPLSIADYKRMYRG
jgi:hypothetical protein